jgi:holo-[acyl-carrier protein] synthase
MHVGVDLIEIERVRRAMERYPSFTARCFTEAERAYCDSRPNPAQHYAARFAGKEAVGKALGFGVARAFAWREVEIAGMPKPSVRLAGRVAERAARLGVAEVDLSMTHSASLRRPSPSPPAAAWSRCTAEEMRVARRANADGTRRARGRRGAAPVPQP